ncbi:helix-turn-helix transcriptional regulator [Chryseobacterium gotjawalense]|uniref:Helix-turn-helix transcriptional regulator n=1 Tax=Chryseobacterium gotjawalense TaxID=3042315 RepID=A0ABY8RH07_9FLAO|nr:helix-turn-helix transcriptional regulator [Chryseobacterium sp. wdc7]WHF52512.1 helix-turn-helix transcriptional regulator [Chryseobacterium sp. wdc7]
MKNTTVTDGVSMETYLTDCRLKVGRSIREIREKRGQSQEQLADKMNISRSTISKIESGKFNCSIDYLSKFAYFLDFEIILQDSQRNL